MHPNSAMTHGKIAIGRPGRINTTGLPPTGALEWSQLQSRITPLPAGVVLSAPLRHGSALDAILLGVGCALNAHHESRLV
jgi:hypothetical protein